MPIMERDMSRGGDGWRGRRAMRELVGTLAALVSLTAATSATADNSVGVRQVYEHGPGAESCPEAEALRARVAELAGSELLDHSRARPGSNSGE